MQTDDSVIPAKLVPDLDRGAGIQDAKWNSRFHKNDKYPFQQQELNCTSGMLMKYHSIIIIIVSAALFALGHVIILGNPTSALTFLPGIVFAWLYLRTDSLLAPILFHGIANVSFTLILNTI